jgi:hypothetical protein
VKGCENFNGFSGYIGNEGNDEGEQMSRRTSRTQSGAKTGIIFVEGQWVCSEIWYHLAVTAPVFEVLL